MMTATPMQTSDAEVQAALLDAARSLRPLVEDCADQTERERQLPDSLVEAMAADGLLTMMVPRDLGGGQVDPRTCVRVLEEIARADGSAGWCLMVAATLSLTAGSLPIDAAREIWGSRRAFVAGSIVGSGQAALVDGGYQVDGRWSFASGCRH